VDDGGGSIASASGLREMVADVSKDTSAGPHQRIAAAEIGLTAGVILAGAERNDDAFDATVAAWHALERARCSAPPEQWQGIQNAQREIAYGMWNQPHFQPEPNAVRAHKMERLRLLTGEPSQDSDEGIEQHLGQIATVSASSDAEKSYREALNALDAAKPTDALEQTLNLVSRGRLDFEFAGFQRRRRTGDGLQEANRYYGEAAKFFEEAGQKGWLALTLDRRADTLARLLDHRDAYEALRDSNRLKALVQGSTR
jgi:hypothetical protein